MRIILTAYAAVIILIAAGILWGVLPSASGEEETGEIITLNGAGATFPSPVYRVWAYKYTEIREGEVRVNYQGLGSGAGINQIRSGTVDFAGTDHPLGADVLEKEGLFQFPMLTGGVVVIVNLPGIGNHELKLDPDVLAGIYLGKIRQWDDPAIQALNPDLKLPSLKITVIRRSDSSGTSFIFTDYLSRVSKEWAEEVGRGSAVKWPLGLGGQKNPGVCNNVSRIRGAIGYTEYTYASEGGLSCVRLKNRSGQFVKAEPDSFRAAAANADWRNAPGFCMNLNDMPGETAWPIVGVTYLLVRKHSPEKSRRDALFRYFNWCFQSGAASAEKLKYVPLPDFLCDLIRTEWERQAGKREQVTP